MKVLIVVVAFLALIWHTIHFIRVDKRLADLEEKVAGGGAEPKAEEGPAEPAQEGGQPQ